jgi:bifunctional DNA-binding transcriptional regulator/antitoxin component of YhaV-PrlF toxin-antitoxin module
MTSLTMSDNGRLLIPVELRERLGFKPKSPIHIEIKDGSLVLTSASQRSAQRRAYFDNLFKELGVDPKRSLVDELIADRRLEAAREATE